jgi:hypothetical protein
MLRFAFAPCTQARLGTPVRAKRRALGTPHCGPVVQRLAHRPFKPVIRVRFPSGLPTLEIQLRKQRFQVGFVDRDVELICLGIVRFIQRLKEPQFGNRVLFGARE